MKVKAWEAENRNNGSTKFYRTYALENGTEIRQWGRIGTTGQFKILSHNGQSAAAASAYGQILAKENRGYRRTRAGELQAPDGAGGKTLSDIFTAHGLDRSDYTDGGPDSDEARPMGGIEALAERALMAIATASERPIDATVAYAQLREEWVEQEEAITMARSYLDTLEQLVTMT